MMKINKVYLQIAAMVVLVFLAHSLMAQPGGGPPTGGGGDPTCWPPPCVPIDGGISLLIALGIAFGGKKLLSLRK